MDPFSQQIAERPVDRALPLKSVHRGERRRFDLDGEVTFIASVMTGMAAMPFAVVDDSKLIGSERRAEAFLDLGGDGPG